MIEQIFTLATCLLSLLIGYFLGRAVSQPFSGRQENGQREAKNPKKNILVRAAVKAGIIEYPSQEQVDYAESGEEKVDEARDKVFREQFKK